MSTLPIVWRFGTMPNARTGEVPCIQHSHYRRRVALHWSGDMGSHHLPPMAPRSDGAKTEITPPGRRLGDRPGFFCAESTYSVFVYTSLPKRAGIRQSAKIRPITRATLAANARFPPTVPQVLSRSYPHQVTQLDRSFSFTFMCYVQPRIM